MATISRNPKILTLVNVFTVDPAMQQKLVEALIGATEDTMKHMPGFISASIHKSHDGTKVVNYAQWKSREDFEAMIRHPDAIPHMKASAAMARFDPILCDVVDSISLTE
ncbi:MAG: antibiotic biosynthesis monooxygenase family protein [Bryobacteraceae bacterium]